MKTVYVIVNRRTSKYLTSEDKWVINGTEARYFKSRKVAEKYAIDSGLTNVIISVAYTN